MLNSIITRPVTMPGFLICLAAAMVLGVLLAMVFSYKSRHSSGFALTLALIPLTVTVIIMLVNGNIGACGNGRIVAIGASTGGTEAIFEVVKRFRRDIPGVVIVQHMPPGFTKMYAERLNNQCEVAVKEAVSGDQVLQGQVLIAPGDRQMKLVKVGDVYQVECRGEEKVSGHCPSVDVLFKSVAKVAGDKAIGVILTGMGGDGAQGLLEMRNAGALTIGQNEASCVVYGMPKVAYDIGAVQSQLDLTAIAGKVYSLLSK